MVIVEIADFIAALNFSFLFSLNVMAYMLRFILLLIGAFQTENCLIQSFFSREPALRIYLAVMVLALIMAALAGSFSTIEMLADFSSSSLSSSDSSSRTSL